MSQFFFRKVDYRVTCTATGVTLSRAASATRVWVERYGDAVKAASNSAL